MEFDKQYRPASFERDIYALWESSHAFCPQPSRTGRTFYLPMPPPNITGNLHVGHSLFLTLQDIMVRYHRMAGDETVYIPGTDHASISTQSRVENKLLKDGIRREDLGREKFLGEVWKWVDEYSHNIKNQIRMMGASCDWSLDRFTMEPKLNRLVEHTFVDMYNKGLIYRGEYMVNFSPKLQSVVSDIEVDYVEEEGSLYYITYFVAGSDYELIVATTRPETLLADQAVAVHPKDKRFKKLIGRTVILPIVNKEIPIIGDDMVDMEFGTGALKITPAHDPADFEFARRHKLRADYSVIDRNGIMTSEAGIFAGQHWSVARENVVELLRSKGNLIKVEPHTHKVGYCTVGKCRIETVVSTQWFVKASELAKRVIQGYKKKEFEIMPSRFNKTFEDWIYHLKDWCISRQLWWGHQIPAYYDKKTGKLLAVGRTEDVEQIYADFGRDNIVRDEDALDTWFSSALWTYAVLDWDPVDPGELFKKFYPAQVLETGSDILFFWVIRMLLMSYAYTGQTPFKTIYLHGLVLSDTGRKMSKSFGTVIDPLDVIRDHSADALRLTLAIGSTPGNNMNFSMKNVENNTVFLNKFWNIIRFAHTNIGMITTPYETLAETIQSRASELLQHEQWILSRLRAITDLSTKGMDAYTFSETGYELFHFVRDEFADVFIEAFKITRGQSPLEREVLGFAILTILRLCHPYVPYITEKLYGIMTDGQMLITAEWPRVPFTRDTTIEKEYTLLAELIGAVRSYRSQSGIRPGDTVDVSCRTVRHRDMIERNTSILIGMLRIGELTLLDPRSHEGDIDGAALVVVRDIDVFVRSDHVAEDMTTEIERIRALITDKQIYARKLDAKLLNSEFLRNAPEHIVRSEQEKRRETREQITKLEEKLKKIGG